MLLLHLLCQKESAQEVKHQGNHLPVHLLQNCAHDWHQTMFP